MEIGKEEIHVQALRILNTVQAIDQSPLKMIFDDWCITDVSGIENAKSDVNFCEKLIVKLQLYQDYLQKFVDHKKNRKSVNDTISLKMAHIYLMRDKKSGFHKIGRSINPIYRERTLQSEMPFIETIFISPLTFKGIEGQLHRQFKEKRVRGEWFNLDQSDIDFIKSYKYGS